MAGVSAGGGEVPIVVSEDQCVLLEDETPMQSSLIWTLLENYYKHMALEAWTHNYVPMFVSSNSRLCKGYATIVFSFLKDYYAKHKEGPVYILELGAGHGRFTFLFLRHLVKLQPLFTAFGMPERPFVVVFTDVAEANVDFVSKHEAMQEFINAGWLDFACLDCNLPGCSGPSDVAVDLRISGQTLRPGTPCVVIANYVFDSLNTDAFQINPEGSVRQCTVKVFSSQEESDPEDCSVLSRMSLKFGWRCLDFPPMEETETSFYMPYGGAQELLYPPSAAVGPNVLKRSVPSKPPVIDDLPTVPIPDHLQTPSVQYILNYYRNLAVKQQSWLSFTVPVGAIRFVMTMKAFSQSNFLLLVGDKGYPDAEEFTVRKDPHIAVHGSLSFMVNLHAIRLAWEGSTSESVVTPYKDCFQVTIFDGMGNTPNMTQSICDMHDYLVPDSLLRIHKLTTEPAVTDTASISQLMATVRLSCHDPEVFVSIRKPLLAAMSGAGVRQEYDVVRDCYEVYKHFYRLHDGDLFPEIAGMACMKAGRLSHAVSFFGDYLKYCPTSCKASVLVNSASCYKALDNLPKALEFANQALEIIPGYQPALEIERSIQMQANPFHLGVLGYSVRLLWTNYAG
ncbi:MAG: hypothetical protein KVP17_003684 [Porospora cf. gigantea B]|uniref:uncharacterized protein n=1 Tax=Porospora cf. gigantea B TaxID=2853592 RepID=UPI003571975B|nr:MAG: hypothetical protein KVP17_003684 [Porospora cf. gigantea B]